MTQIDPSRPWLATNPVFRDWRAVGPHLPYRASVPRDITWAVDLPDPDLVDAWRNCRGGRRMTAFETAEVRDLFVEGHAHQGATVEADFADTPASRDRKRKADPDPYRDLSAERLVELLREAGEEDDAATREVDEVFGAKAKSRLSAGDVAGALAVAKAAPKASPFKDLLLGRLLANGAWDTAATPFARIDPVRMDAAMAKAWARMARSDKAFSTLENLVGERVRPTVSAMADDDLDEARAYVETLPRGMYKASLMDMLRRKAKEPTADVSPAAPAPRP